MNSKMSMLTLNMATWSLIVLLTGSSVWAQSAATTEQAGTAGINRAPQALIDQHLDRPWLKANLLDLVSHVVDNAEAPNGYVPPMSTPK